MTTDFPVHIEEYDASWPARFAQIAGRAQAALGDIVLRVEHIGSAAVPGLAAKPIIDLDVVLKSAADSPTAIERLAVLGHVHEGDLGITGREAFRCPRGESQHHLYVLAESAPELQRHLTFRDKLRANPLTRDQYTRLKQSSAARVRDRRESTESKSAFVRELLAIGHDTFATAGAWRSTQPEEARFWFQQVDAPWWIAGGWSLDLFVGHQTRPRGDLDIGILRRDAVGIPANLPSWELLPRPEVNSLWGRPIGSELWVTELLLDEADGDQWLYPSSASDLEADRHCHAAYRSGGPPHGQPRRSSSRPGFPAAISCSLLLSMDK
jgi:GrpB-like predicted nucleotidyltransferase (UPF0157 family)